MKNYQWCLWWSGFKGGKVMHTREQIIPTGISWNQTCLFLELSYKAGKRCGFQQMWCPVSMHAPSCLFSFKSRLLHRFIINTDHALNKSLSNPGQEIPLSSYPDQPPDPYPMDPKAGPAFHPGYAPVFPYPPTVPAQYPLYPPGPPYYNPSGKKRV